MTPKLTSHLLNGGKLALFLIAILSIPAQAFSDEEKSYKQEVVVEGLNMPWAIAFLSETEWLVTERLTGELRLIQNGQLHPDPIGGVPEVWARGQGGLLDVVAHPNYKENGWIYLSYASPHKPGEPGQGANTEFIRARIKNHELTDIQVLFKAMPNRTSTPISVVVSSSMEKDISFCQWENEEKWIRRKTCLRTKAVSSV